MRTSQRPPILLCTSRPAVWAGVVAATLICQASALAQTAPAAATTATAKPQTTKVVAATPDDSWNNLNASQQTALAPLALTWQTLSAGQKNKWLELSKNYAALPAPEQAKLQMRMGDWAKLSTQQRAQARHNFAVNQAITSGLTPEQRAAQWQAYQLLSPQEKQALAARSGKAPVATAANPRPAEPLKNTPAAQFGSAKALAAQSKNTVPSASKISIAPHLQKGNSIKSSVSVAGDKSSTSGDGSAATARQ